MRTRTTVWLPALAALALVALARWQPHDSDSRLYAAMAEDLAARPWRLWIAPEWQGHWQRTGLFVEHPAGHLALAAALVLLGASGTFAVAGLNILGWALGLELVYRLGKGLGNAAVGRRATWLWGASPMFLQYLVRGNQEHPLAACVLAALAGVALLPPVLAAVGFAAATAMALAVKGLAGLAAVPLGLVAACLVPQARSQRLWAWAAGTALLVPMVTGYLGAFAEVTHQSFWQLHLAQQVGHSVGHGLDPLQKLKNLAYYLSRPTWYAFAALAVWGLGAWRLGGRWAVCLPLQRLGVAAWVVYVGGFSLADRKADRYLFVLYPLLALAAAASWEGAAAGRRPAWCGRLARLAASDRWQGAALVGAVACKLLLGQTAYLFIRAWPGS